MSEAHPFLFGKLPAFGDFLSRGLTPAARAIWDRRCVATLAAVRSGAGGDFTQAVEALPPRGFVLEPESGEAFWQAGCAAFSCDRAGRPFLFVLGVAGGQALRDEGAGMAARLERCVYDAFRQPGDVAAILDNAVDALGEPRVETTAGWTLMRGWQPDWTAA